MEKVISSVFLIISMVLGTGMSVRYLHDEARKLAIGVITKKQPSLAAFTRKLTKK